MEIKKFIKKYESKIIAVTFVGGVILGAVLTGKYLKLKTNNIEVNLVNKLNSITTEEAIDYILNASEDDKFGVFKEGPLFQIVEL